MNKRISIIATAGALAILAAAPVAARDERNANTQTRSSTAVQHRAQVGPISLAGWEQTELKSGLSVERLIGMHVRDRSDRSIGEIDNMLVTRDGRVTAVIVSAGGVLGLGETYFRVPWNQVRFHQRTNSVNVPIARDNIERFRWGAEQVAMAANELKVRDLMDGSVALRDGSRYGDLDDLIIGRDGRLKALVVTSAAFAGVPGRFAFTYRGEVFYRESEKTFNLPYTRDELTDMRPLEYDRLGIGMSTGLGAEGRVGGNRAYDRR